MVLPGFMTTLLRDPAPRWAFELSEAGLAVARAARPPETGFHPLDPDVISPSPVRDNILRMEALSARVQALAPRGEKKRQRAVLILPDYAVRVSVLDFDSFPSDAGQQLSLVRFRIKKSLPFDIDAAGVSYFPQPAAGRVDVVVAVAPLEIIARYELPFRSAGYHPGLVTTSTLCALELVKSTGPALLARVSGRTLTLAVLDADRLRLLRSIELAGDAGEIASHLYPTFAFMDDQLGAGPRQVFTCGLTAHANQELSEEIGQTCEPLRSRFGIPDQFNAGLLGYLESLEQLQ